MGMTKTEAYELLGSSQGASLSELTVNYKKLALEWYPQKHEYSLECIEKFRKISHAYKMLTRGSNERMSMDDMIRLFQEVFFSRTAESSSDDDSYCDYDSDDHEFYFGIDSNSENSYPFTGKNSLSNAERIERAMKNAEDLIAQEEKEKKKAERRRAKKKRQKLKKKKEKEMAQKKNNMEKKEDVKEENNNKESDSSDSEEEGIDPNSAFVAIAASKKKVHKPLKKENTKKTEFGDEENFVYSESIILQSRQLAVRAIEMANVEQYQAAIDLFTEAIKLFPKDFRYFGNRSYCFDRINLYERALKDSEKAIALSPQWAKGYFRKGRALCGLRRYSEAETCFEIVVKLDKDCKEATQELTVIRMLQLIEMGFSKQQAEYASKEHKSVQAALESLVSGNGPGRFPPLQLQQSNSADDEIYQSDDDDFTLAARIRRQPSDEKMNPRNPDGFTSLWVGNIKPEVTEKALTTLFGKYGEVWVRVLPEKFCAFINYKERNSASRAMSDLQGKEYYGAHLVIRFPDNPHNYGQSSVTILRKKGPAAPKPEEKPKIKGPVNGNECYFFRTTGCVYGEHCRFLHIKEHKGIDADNYRCK